MLAELYALSKTLADYGLLRPTTHPDVRSVAKTPCLLVTIDEKGRPRTLRLLDKEKSSHLWRHSKGNHNSFPAIRIQSPLLCAAESQKRVTADWKKLDESDKQSLLEALDYSSVNPASRDIRISEWSLDRLQGIQQSDSPDLKALELLIQRFPKRENQDAFYSDLLALFKTEVERMPGEPLLDFMADALLGIWDENKGRFCSGCMFYFDVYEISRIPCVVAGAATKQALIETLNKNDFQTIGTRKSPHSLLGSDEDLVETKYPSPTLPILGTTFLYSKKEDTACLMRYGMKGVGAFGASRSAVAAICDSLAFLTEEQRCRKTWTSITDCDRPKSNLLLAYVDNSPESEACIAASLGDYDSYVDVVEAGGADYDELVETFEVLCEQVLGELKAVLKKNSESKIIILILESLDPGRKQLLYGNSFTAEQYRNNILRWIQASGNVPSISFRLKAKRTAQRALGKGTEQDRKTLQILSPRLLSPGEICGLLKTHYVRSGSSKRAKLKASSSLSIDDVFKLYMPQQVRGTEWEELIERIMDKVLKKVKWLLIDLEMAQTLNGLLEQRDRGRVIDACRAVSLISILLWHKGIRREEYVMDVPFNIGQLLKLSDALHKEYCIEVRNRGDKKKSLPPQLIGNQMFLLAMENPNDALRRLSDRMCIYKAWAVSSRSGLAGWILARFEEVCDKLAGKEIPKTFDTAEQAQVLLGYLAAIPYEKKEEKNTPKEDDTNE
jgi:hypothetical protein